MESEPPRDASAAHAGRRKLLIHAVFGVVGAAALGLLVKSVGLETMASVLRGTAHFLPLLFAIDSLRCVCEAVATWSLSPHVRERVPISELARVHLVGYAVSMTMPAGRATGETVKAAMLTHYVGVSEAAAIGAANQAMSLFAGGVIGACCLLASLIMTGTSPLSLAIGLFTVATLLAFTGLQIACRSRGLAGALLRRFDKLATAGASFQDALDKIPLFPPGAMAAAVASRVVAVAELGVVLWILGARHGPGAALLAQGVSLVAGSIGDLVPGQLGAADGAFALAAPYLGVEVATGVAIGVLQHGVQAIWAVVGWTVPFFWKAPR